MLPYYVTFFYLFAFAVVSSENEVIRETIYGQVRGKLTTRIPGKIVEEYLSVPYARPPVGSYRFKRPENPLPWKPNILETTVLPPACPTHNLAYIQVHRPDLTETKEDCLYLNVYVPKTTNKALPILLFIHGGDNADGTSSMFDGDIIAGMENIIMITINYRVSVLGFYANRKDGIEANNGLFDQLKAMTWVKENIQFFNGDPSKVTLHGHSAGAADVGLHLVSSLSKGLFRYAIIHSGSPFAHWFMSDCVKNSRKQTFPENCKPGTSLTNSKVSRKIKQLMNNGSIDDFMASIKLGEDTFRVVIDGTFVTDSPEQTLRCQPINAESILMIMARDEGYEPRVAEIEKYYRGLKIAQIVKKHKYLFPDEDDFEVNFLKTFKEWQDNNISSYPHTLHMMADINFFASMIKLADVISERMRNISVLSFEYVSENIPGPDWIGVQHGWDLFYLFGVPFVGHKSHWYYTERDKAVSRKSMELLSNFVRHGYLSLNGEDKLTTRYNAYWKSYNKFDFENGTTVLTSETDFRSPRMEFWYKYFFPNDTEFICISCATMSKYSTIVLFGLTYYICVFSCS